MSDKIKLEDKTEQQRAEAFIKEYQELCEKHQFQLVISPAFKARDDGTWSVVLQSSVGKLPKKN
jgi:hypothetical protein